MTAAQLDQRLLLKQVLRPYRDNCKYLKSAQLIERDDSVSARGRFEIARSCYIDDTGHFNAVEFNICYNQLGYHLIANCVSEGLAPTAWTMSDFWDRQLSNIFIYKYSSKFTRPITPRSFEGEVVFGKPVLKERPDRPPIMFMDTVCAFWDDGGGSAEGQITLAFTSLP